MRSSISSISRRRRPPTGPSSNSRRGAGIGVICQKPFATSLEDARAMVAACESAGVPLMVHENFRWQSAIRAVARERSTPAPSARRSGAASHSGPPTMCSAVSPISPTGKRFIIEDLGHPHPRCRPFPVWRRRARDRAHAARQSGDPGRRRRDDAARPRKRRHFDCRLQLRDAAGGRTVSRDAGRGRRVRRQLSSRPGLRTAWSRTSKAPIAKDVSPPLLPWASRPWHNIQESVQRDPAALGRLPARGAHAGYFRTATI